MRTANVRCVIIASAITFLVSSAQACPELTGIFHCVAREEFAGLLVKISQNDLTYDFEIVDLDYGNEGFNRMVADGKTRSWPSLRDGFSNSYCDGQILKLDFEGIGYPNTPTEGTESYFLVDQTHLEIVSTLVLDRRFAKVNHFDCERKKSQLSGMKMPRNLNLRTEARSLMSAQKR